MTVQTRQPLGIPTGGQFAAAAHQEPQLTLAAADAGIAEKERWLAAGGLIATLKKGNRDYRYRYTSPAGRSVLLEHLGTDSALIKCGTSMTATGWHGASAETDVQAIRDMLWSHALDEATKGHPESFTRGGYGPKPRAPWVTIGVDGSLSMNLAITGDYSSDSTHLSHDYGTGRTAVHRRLTLDRMDAIRANLKDIISAMKWPWAEGADAQEESTRTFEMILSRACADPDAHPDVLAAIRSNPALVAASTRFPQYRTTADLSELDTEADKAGNRILHNPSTGNLEVRTGTATYSVCVEITRDGSFSRTLNGGIVEAFPAGYRKAEGMEGWIRRRKDRLLAAAAQSYQFDPSA